MSPTPAAGRKTGSQFGRAATVNGTQYVQEVFNNSSRLQISFFGENKNSLVTIVIMSETSSIYHLD